MRCFDTAKTSPSCAARPVQTALRCHSLPSSRCHHARTRAMGQPIRQLSRTNVRRTIARVHDEDGLQEVKLGPDVVASVRDVKDGSLKYSLATVMRNDAVNLEGSIRLLHLTISDPVDILYGRRLKAVQEHTRWGDSYTVPGQFVCLRFGAPSNPGPPKRMFSIASSPYESKRDSAYVGGCIIEIVAERGCSQDDDQLAGLGPGSQLEVSQVIGRGFSSLFNSYVGLLSTLEESRNMLIIAVGTSGMAPARATLRWTPVQAHATARQVTCYYVAQSASQAAFLSEWDTWRDAGVKFNSLYTNSLSQDSVSNGSSANSADSPSVDSLSFDIDANVEGGGQASGGGLEKSSGTPGPRGLPPAAQLPAKAVKELLDEALFSSNASLEAAVGCKASEISVLLAGCTGELASSLTRKLVQRGVASERVLYCDYF